MDKNQIFNYLTGSLQSYTLGDMAINLFITFILMMLIFAVYTVTHKGNGTFSTDFGFTVILTGLVTAVIMMTIESNLALSLGMVGALSIIRFRTAIKDPKDTSFVFWSVATGLCAGTGGYVLAVLSCAAIGCFVIVYSMLVKSYPQNMLIVRADGRMQYDSLTALLDKYGVKYSLKMKEVTHNNQHIILKVSGKKVDIIAEKIMKIEHVISACVAWEGEE